MIRADTGLVQDEESIMGGVSWRTRSTMGPLRGVVDVADESGRRNRYIHTLHTKALVAELNRLPHQIHRALDFGCGTGRFLKVLSSRSLTLYALDREPSMVDAARFHAGAFVKQLLVWNSDRVPFDDGFFDFILSFSVLSVTPSPLFDVSLKEMARVLGAGGTLLLFEKVSTARSLTLERYHDVLGAYGFEIVRERPVRSPSSPLTALITKTGWIPRQAFSLLAATELAFMKGRTYHDPDPYVEYAIVARKRT